MQGGLYRRYGVTIRLTCFVGLQRVRDNLMAQLLELGKSKPRGKESEATGLC